MNIIIATDNYPPRYDGISRFLTEITPALNTEHSVHVIAPDYGPTDDPWPVTKVKATRIQIGDYHPPALHFIKILRRVRKADAVFTQTLGSIGALALLAGKLSGKKTVHYTHGVEWELVPRALQNNALKRLLPGLLKLVDRLVYSWIDLLLVPSQSVSETFYWNKIENKRRVIHLGVDTDAFSPATDKKAAKKKLGIDEDALVVGYHGRLAREKDLRTLLRGWLRFRSRNPGTKTHLLVVGDGLREVRQVLERDGVTVTGFQEDVVPFLHAMDAYVLSSLTETSCLSVMEAMSCALPVISTRVGYVKDYITDGKNGLFFPEKDTVMLARRLEELQDEQRREELGRAARKTMKEKFSWDATRDEILRIFDQL